MILATHALTGAVIGKSLHSSWEIIILSLAVHYAMDTLRHGEYFDDRTATVKNTWWKVALDLIAGLSIISLSLFWQKASLQTITNVLLGALFSLIPDLLTVLHWKFKNIRILAKIKSFHAQVHLYDRYPKYSKERRWTVRNAANDIIISALAIIILFSR